AVGKHHEHQPPPQLPSQYPNGGFLFLVVPPYVQKRHFHGQNVSDIKKIYGRNPSSSTQEADGPIPQIPAVWADVIGSFVRRRVGEIRCPKIVGLLGSSAAHIIR
ncbi:hypothetical protein THAOC_23449, partial [Thalassiosira oceanica]